MHQRMHSISLQLQYLAIPMSTHRQLHNLTHPIDGDNQRTTATDDTDDHFDYLLT